MEIKNIENSSEKGLFATKKYRKGERVHTLIGEIYDKPTRETIRIEYDRHIYDNYGKFINHSFNPNIDILYDDIITLHDINIGDELVFNYNKNECTMANPFYVNGILVCGNSELDIQDFRKEVTSKFRTAHSINNYNPITLTIKLPSVLDYDIDTQPILEKSNDNS